MFISKKRYNEKIDYLKDIIEQSKSYKFMWKDEVIKNQEMENKINGLENTIEAIKEPGVKERYKEVEITQKILVDNCIADEIVYLNSQGVRTEGCCCGHGKEKANAIIKPSSKPKAKELGYEVYFVEEYGYNGQWVIYLKSQCEC